MSHQTDKSPKGAKSANTSGGDHDNDGKDPRRVAAGHKAYETRLHHQEEGNDDPQQNAGRGEHQGAQTRRSGGHDGDAGKGKENDDGKDPKRVEAGKKAAETRRNKAQGGDGQQSDEEDHDGKDPKRVEAGKKAAETRRNKAQGGDGQQSDEEDHDGKDPKRVEAGKKAAETRRNKSHGGDDQKTDEDDHDGKDPKRVEAGKKGAAARWGKDSLHDNKEEGKSDHEDGEMRDEDEATASPKGATARHGTKHPIQSDSSQAPEAKHPRYSDSGNQGGGDRSGDQEKHADHDINIKINVGSDGNVKLVMDDGEGSKSEIAHTGKH